MEILTSVRRLYISFKSLVNDFVYSFGRAALLLLVEVQNHTVPVRERRRIRVKSPDISYAPGYSEFLLRPTSVPLRPVNCFFTKKLLTVIIVRLKKNKSFDVKLLRSERMQCGHVVLILLWLCSLCGSHSVVAVFVVETCKFLEEKRQLRCKVSHMQPPGYFSK